MGILRLLFLSSLLITTAYVESRPISWSGGSTLMYKTNSMISSYYYHFSPSYQYSIGAEYINDRYFNEQYINIRSTYLLDRKNTKSSQAIRLFLCDFGYQLCNIQRGSRRFPRPQRCRKNHLPRCDHRKDRSHRGGCGVQGAIPHRHA